ncbi:MAG: hypothetical protein WCO84_03500 [bacterium]
MPMAMCYPKLDYVPGSQTVESHLMLTVVMGDGRRLKNDIIKSFYDSDWKKLSSARRDDIEATRPLDEVQVDKHGNVDQEELSKWFLRARDHERARKKGRIDPDQCEQM